MVFAWANTHKPLPARGQVLSLTDLALDCLAANPSVVVDLSCTDEHLALGLLYRLLEAGRLDYRLACIFHAAGHASITSAMESLNILDAVPTHNTIPEPSRR